MVAFNKQELSAARASLKPYGFSSLLAEPTANPKLAKGLALGVMTAPLHLAPASLSGYNVCPMATQGCIKACLHTAGNPLYMPGKAKARIARTKAYFEQREAFMLVLAGEIAKLEKAALAAGMLAGIRLNATSDIPWEKIPVTIDGRKFENLMRAFPDIKFYDYTKRANRKNLPSNYSLTFSLAENNDVQAIEALRNGMNVAAVFSTPRGKPLPNWIMGFTAMNEAVRFAALDDVSYEFYRNHSKSGQKELYPIIDGDEHDFRPFDPIGVIVGLRAKGAARQDTSGFVRPAV
jgi:hypothetical protein